MEDKCEICGERHHPRQAHRFAVVNKVDEVVVNKRSLDRHRKEPRRAYMREYMRRRRAEQVT